VPAWNAPFFAPPFFARLNWWPTSRTACSSPDDRPIRRGCSWKHTRFDASALFFIRGSVLPSVGSPDCRSHLFAAACLDDTDNGDTQLCLLSPQRVARQCGSPAMPSRSRPARMHWFQGDYAEHAAGRPRLPGIQSLKIHIPINRQGGFQSWVSPGPFSPGPFFIWPSGHVQFPRAIATTDAVVRCLPPQRRLE
jgi:hypothetical protein